MSIVLPSAGGTTSRTPFPGMRKRAFDVCVAAFTLVLIAPLLAIIAVAIRCDSRGPVLFRQERMGRNGQPFRILKFRTMRVGADRLGAHISPTGDPRVTRVGRWLRRSYVDELPQLLNVLRGDMSLVGPRPETPDFLPFYRPDEIRVLSLRPGVMGPSTLDGMHEEDRLAAAEDPLGYYVSTILHERVQADLAYVDSWSLRHDLRLMSRQILAILRRLR
jgi:lipopolysaccharide/colanic/teichoic acid biosynthesis glycosyltransferase